tara:strand:+ start:3316 stop:4434 length:1119 start_codon:yes stop_codon:yes gene_type:complete
LGDEPLSGTDAKIDKVIDFFESKEIDRLGKMVRFVTEKIENDLTKKGILARVSSRVKSSQSLRVKLQKWSRNPEKVTQLDGDPEHVLAKVSDLAAARIMTYTEQDRDAVAQAIKERFSSPEDYGDDYDLEKKEEHPRIRNEPRNHYRATHMMVSLRKDDLRGNYANLKCDKCELQITSLLAHVWNEIEHDTVYKPLAGALSEPECDAIDSLGHLTKTGDNIIQSLLHSRELREDRERQDVNLRKESFRDENDLFYFLGKHYGSKINGIWVDFSLGLTELLSCLRALKWDHPREVAIHFSPCSLLEARKEALAISRFLTRNERIRPSVSAETCDLFIISAFMMRLSELEVQFSMLHRNKREAAMLSVYKEKIG